jgi:hypothetical protein
MLRPGALIMYILFPSGMSLSGFVTIWPTGAVQPTASVLQYNPNQGVMALAINVPLSADGKISIYLHNDAGHMVLDVTGYYIPVDP